MNNENEQFEEATEEIKEAVEAAGSKLSDRTQKLIKRGLYFGAGLATGIILHKIFSRETDTVTIVAEEV